MTVEPSNQPAKRKRFGALEIVLLLPALAGLGLGTYVLMYTLGRSSPRPDDLLTAGAMLGGGVLFLAIVLGRSLGKIGVVLGVLLLGGVAAVTILLHGNAEDQRRARSEAEAARKKLWKELYVVCKPGEALSAAKAYERTPGIHKTVAFRFPQDWPRPRYGEEAWKPSSVEEVEVVVCLADASKSVQFCSYDLYGQGGGGFGSVSWEQAGYKATAYAAKTREVLGEQTFLGKPPNAPESCPTGYTFSASRTSVTNTGGLPDDAGIKAFLKSFAVVE